MSLMNVQIFAHLKDMGFVFLLLNFESISCILNVSPLVDLYHFKIFSLFFVVLFLFFSFFKKIMYLFLVYFTILY